MRILPALFPTAILALAILASAGCRTFADPARSHDLEAGKAYWFDYDATRRGGVALPPDSNLKIIAEPAPDTALESVAELVGKLKTDTVDAEVQAKISEKIIELGQVTERIKFLRESLYRLSEAAHNYGLTAGEFKPLFESVIKISATLADTEKAKAETEKARAEGFRTLMESKAGDPKFDLQEAIRSLPH
jgi:hypothetical protein